jgi:Rrf2 family protein
MMDAVKLPESTEWALHSVASAAQLEPGAAVSAAQLAEHFGVPPAYLAKQLQSLVRAGILSATTGPRGGFRLARPASDITLFDVVAAVDGNKSPYVCREIRQQGTGALPRSQCREPCILAAKMADAYAAWRASLESVTVADILATLTSTTLARTQRLLARS